MRCFFTVGLLLLFLCSCGPATTPTLTSPLPSKTATGTAFVSEIVPATPASTATNTPKPTTTPIPWQAYEMTYTITRGEFSKLWMPIPREWDGIGMKDVAVISISPEPDDLYEDVQGNLIAYWAAGNRGTTEYSVTYQIKLAPIYYVVNSEQIGEYDTSTREHQRYTQPSQMIQSTNVEIIELAQQVVGDESNPYEQAKLIHHWVSTNISSGDNVDAITTLGKRSGDCGGHSALFIALLRSIGIPSRTVGGLTTLYLGEFKSGDARKGTLGIHIWSEFYLPGHGWIQTDTSAGPQNFTEINEPRIVLFRGEDIELGHNFPLGTTPWFHAPNRDVMDNSTPPTFTWGESLTLLVEYLP